MVPEIPFLVQIAFDDGKRLDQYTVLFVLSSEIIRFEDPNSTVWKVLTCLALILELMIRLFFF